MTPHPSLQLDTHARPSGEESPGALDYFYCLIGDDRAIRKCVADDDTIFVGGVIGLNAGLAIGSTHAYLLKSPWLVVLPFVVSWVIVLILSKASRRSLFGIILLSFATQLIGSLPFDLLFPRPLVQYTNVFGWRIATIIQLVLVTRFVSVINQVSVVQASMRVIPFISIVLIAIELIPPYRNWHVLGELLVIRLSGIDSLCSVFDIAMLICAAVSLLVSILYHLSQHTNKVGVSRDLGRVRRRRSSINGVMMSVLIVSALFWLTVISINQPKQRLSTMVDDRLSSGELQDALLIMNSHEEQEFPRTWDTVPRLANRPLRPDILDVVEEVARTNCKPWVRDRFLLKFRCYIGHRIRFNPEFYFRDSVHSIDLARVTSLLERLPEGPAIASEHVPTMEVLIEGWRERLNTEELRDFARWSRLAEKGGFLRPKSNTKPEVLKDRVPK